MTAKQIFLNRIKGKLEASENEAKMYKEAYVQNEKLPDTFFENLIDIAVSRDEADNLTTPYASPLVVHRTEENENDYGRNKRLVIEILNKAGKAMLKSTIVTMFEEIVKEKDQSKVVTNAIASLSHDGLLMGYKPTGLKFRGNYWAIKSWMIDDKTIKDEYAPIPVTRLERYLITA